MSTRAGALGGPEREGRDGGLGSGRRANVLPGRRRERADLSKYVSMHAPGGERGMADGENSKCCPGGSAHAVLPILLLLPGQEKRDSTFPGTAWPCTMTTSEAT